MKRIAFALALVITVVSDVAISDTAARIAIDNFTFSPPSLTVHRGTTVTWTNHDDIPHSIVVLGADATKSAPLDTDGSYTLRFDKAGTFAYICGLHPHMHGQITVE